MNQDIYPGEYLLHKKYAQSEMLFNLVWTHSNIIADIATQLYDRDTFDKSQLKREYVIQAALLHDIGVYLCGGFEWAPNQPPSDKPYIQHTIVGAWILQQEGYLPEIIQVAHNHTGVGLTSQDITTFGLELPPEDYVPRTLLARLIAYASKFHSKTPKFRVTDDIRASLQKFGTEKVKVFDSWVAEFGEPDLEAIKPKYEEWHKAFAFQQQHLTPQTGVALNTAGISQIPKG